MRIFDLRDIDFHDKERSGHIVPGFLGKTKRYDLHEIYRIIDESKTRHATCSDK